MSKLIVSAIGLVLLTLMPLMAHANNWTAGGTDNLWTNADNWSQGIVPLNSFSNPISGWDDPAGFFYPLTPDTSDDGPALNNDAMLIEEGATVLIDSTVHATAYGVRVGNGGQATTLEITGGQLDIGIDPNVDPSVNAVGWHFDIGRNFNKSGDPNSKQRVNMSGGIVNTNGLIIPEQFVDHSLVDPTDSAPLNGELVMTGGTINARWWKMGQLKGNGMAELSGDAVINIASNVANDPANGGHLVFNRDWNYLGQPVPSTGQVSLDISEAAEINISGHLSQTIVQADQSEVTRYESYVTSGELTAWGGNMDPVITLDDGVITISAPQIAGDYNLDGYVDAADYTVWRDNLGESIELTGEDPNAATPGVVDQEDYDYWALNYGMSAFGGSSSSVAVPEPSSLMLMALIAAMPFGRSQRPRVSSTNTLFREKSCQS